MRVLIIGTNRPCHYRLQERGHQIVLFMPRHRIIADDLHGPYQHVVMLDDDTPTELWAATAAAFHANQPFDAVAAYNDQVQATAYAVAQHLGVPCTIDIDLLHLVANKADMRKALDQHGIPSCRYQFAQGRAALLAAIETIGFPCIVKPVAGEASEGVARIDNAAGIAEALDWVGAANIETGVMVEEFLVGEEFSVEAISSNGQHHVVAITKKFKDAKTFVEIGHLVPAPVPQADYLAIEQYVKRILAAFGFNNTPSHTELMLTADGPRIIETHTRIGGDRIIELVNYATGVDLYDLVAVQSLGTDITPLLPATIVSNQSAAIWYADPSASESQQLAEVRGMTEIKQLSYIKAFDLIRKPGSRGSAVRHSFDRSALAIAVGESPDQALERARGAIKSLDFLYVWKPAAAVAEHA
ncbi:ATP-grasp domain-containing protein [Amantichitinum ursilacus]|uniref:Alanine-anticapsin ligase BacD n=1 Tax=Amantichitinum ursilacus TaxID=857265 RepID=A0A0N0XIH9_9NEIS|nr:ATP-grasp domain-containing protein [Amantichitinum ursilacus]KPC52717.1 Alanine-anticapsin ligase BacD [Amantichitinum ursilacus]